MTAKSLTELDNTSILRTMQHAQATPNRTGGGAYLYALYLVNATTGEPITTFGFDIPPQSIRQSEPFASDIAAGQEGGFWTDDRGQYFRNLAIAGTFGFRPTRGSGQMLGGALGSLPSQAVKSAQQLTSAASSLSEGTVGGLPKIPNKEKTGFDRLRELLNLFRQYGDLKRYRDTASSVVMVWANWKTGEVYLVQPLQFERDRSVPSGRFQYKYSFSLRMLKPLQVTVPNDFLKNPSSRRGKRSWIGKIKQAAAIVDAFSNVLAGTATAALDLASDITGSILSVASAASEFVQTLLNVGYAAADFPLEQLRTAHRLCQDLAMELGAAADYQAVDLGREATKAGRAFASLFIGLKFFAQGDVNNEAAAYERKYRGPDVDEDDPEVFFNNDGGGPYNFRGNIPSGSTTQNVPHGATIRNIAALHLGSSARWKEICLLNNLQYPYIDPNGDGVLVLRPGDRILIPSELSDVEDGGVINTTRKDPDAFDFGWDLAVSLKTREFSVDAGGDLAIVGGKENLRQALSVKIWTEPGELVLHPWFGFEPNVGQAMTIDLLAKYHLQMKTTLLSDTRIGSIKYLGFKTRGDQLFVSAVLIPKGQNSEVALSSLRVGTAN